MPNVPLAWQNLTHDPIRFVLFVLGIAFAVILMFVQFGFRNALLDANTLFHETLNADLILVSPTRQAMSMPERFPRRRLEQARSVPGVADVQPVYVDGIASTLSPLNPPPDAPRQTIRVVGVPVNADILHVRGAPDLSRLATPGTAYYDSRTKKADNDPSSTIFGHMAPGAQLELAGRPITLLGEFTLGTDFTTDGTLIVSEQTFLDYLRRPFTYPGSSPEATLELGLIRLSPGADASTVQAELKRALATGEALPDTDVITKAQLIDREKTFWLNNTPIGFAFGFGMFMGFAVGLVICYQILSGDVADHLSEYATLKAMGYSNAALAWVVLQEAIILAVAGFACGAAVSWGAYEFLSGATGMPMRMTPDRFLGLLAATVFMCCLSGLVALVGLFRVDPADVF